MGFCYWCAANEWRLTARDILNLWMYRRYRQSWFHQNGTKLFTTILKLLGRGCWYTLGAYLLRNAPLWIVCLMKMIEKVNRLFVFGSNIEFSVGWFFRVTFTWNGFFKESMGFFYLTYAIGVFAFFFSVASCSSIFIIFFIIVSVYLRWGEFEK